MERESASFANKTDVPSSPQRRPKPSPAAAPQHPLDRLQQSMGNRGVGWWIQTKLEVGAPNDAFEQEADRIADQVVSSSGAVNAPRAGAPALPQRKCACGGGGEGECEQCAANRTMQMKRDGSSRVVDASAAGVHSFAGGGEQLPAPVRSFFESRFHHDFSGVRVHQDTRAAESARSLGARAYTFGPDIVFGSGEYSPDSDRGAKLLAHELTHVMQQGAGRPMGSGPNVSAAGPRIQRQLITPLGQGGGFGGLMERDRQFAIRSASTPHPGLFPATPGPGARLHLRPCIHQISAFSIRGHHSDVHAHRWRMEQRGVRDGRAEMG